MSEIEVGFDGRTFGRGDLNVDGTGGKLGGVEFEDYLGGSRTSAAHENAFPAHLSGRNAAVLHDGRVARSNTYLFLRETFDERISLLQSTVDLYDKGAPPSGLEGGGFGVVRVPKQLKRYYGQGQLHFVTFSCYRRLPLLGTMQARNLFVKELGRVRQEYGFLLVGYVLMPNHVHLLISEPKNGTPSTVLQMLKQQVSRKLRKTKQATPKAQGRRAFPEFIGGLSQFWQPRF